MRGGRRGPRLGVRSLGAASMGTVVLELLHVLVELLAQMEARSMAKEAGDFLDTLPRPDGWTGSWTSGVLAAGRPQERVVSLDGQPGPGKRAGAERHHTAAWPPPRPPRCAARLARDASGARQQEVRGHVRVCENLGS